jgi:hypothetical protein
MTGSLCYLLKVFPCHICHGTVAEKIEMAIKINVKECNIQSIAKVMDKI